MAKLEEIINQLLQNLSDPFSENIHRLFHFPPEEKKKILEAVEEEYQKKVKNIPALKSWKEIKDHKGSIKVIEQADNVINNYGVEGFDSLINDGNNYLLFSSDQLDEKQRDEWLNFTSSLALNDYNGEEIEREDNEIPDTKKEIEVFKEPEHEPGPGEQLDKTASLVSSFVFFVLFVLYVLLDFFEDELGKRWRLVKAIIGGFDIVYGFFVLKYREKIKKIIISILKKFPKFKAR